MKMISWHFTETKSQKQATKSKEWNQDQGHLWVPCWYLADQISHTHSIFSSILYDAVEGLLQIDSWF